MKYLVFLAILQSSCLHLRPDVRYGDFIKPVGFYSACCIEVYGMYITSNNEVYYQGDMTCNNGITQTVTKVDFPQDAPYDAASSKDCPLPKIR